MSEELSRRSVKKERKQRERERVRVEKEYAKAHPTSITVVTPETRKEIRLTRKGRYELGSDGNLTANGKTTRLAHRYNVAIFTLILLIVATYAYFFLVN